MQQHRHLRRGNGNGLLQGIKQVFVAQHAHLFRRQRQFVQQQQNGTVARALQAVALRKVLWQPLPQRQGQGVAELLNGWGALAAVKLRHRAGLQPPLLYGKSVNAVQHAPVAPARNGAQTAFGLVVRTLTRTDAQKRHHIVCLCFMPMATHWQGKGGTR